MHFTGEDAKGGASFSLRWQKCLREAGRVCRMNTGRGEARSSGSLGAQTGGGQVCSPEGEQQSLPCGLRGQVTGLQATPVPQFLDPVKWVHCGWGSVRITGHPGRGCKGLSGQPEVLPGHLPPGVLGKHIGEAQTPPTQLPVLLWCWLRKQEQSSGGSPVGWGPSGYGRAVVAKSLCLGTAVPVWLPGAIRGREYHKTPFSRHAPRVVHL